MKNIKLFLSVIFIAISFTSNASHLFGGEITWTCLGNGQYQFTVKMYRDCNGIPYFADTAINVFGHPTVCSIPLDQSLFYIADISPSQCPNTCLTGGVGTVQEIIQKSFPITLSGVPPATGWVFDMSSCCRSGLNNITGTTQTYSIRSIMYSYNGANADPCFDSSPFFAERPNIFTCIGFPFKYNPNGIDSDHDSLVYAWANVVNQPTNSTCASYNAASIPFIPPYSASNQLPGTPTINTKTGEVNFYVTTANGVTGNFATCMKVTAYKCGIKVAEVFRDCNYTLISGCTVQGVPPNNINLPPVVNPPFNGSFADTVIVGDTVDFNLYMLDGQANLNGTPQQLFVPVASGEDFGTGFTSDSTGCPFPPCATLTPPPSPIFGSPISMIKHFVWVTSCQSIANCYSDKTNTHRFVVKASDNYCPAPASTYVTILITVVGPSINQSNDSLWISYSGASSYQWYQNGNLITGATDSLYVTSVPGNYSCQIGTSSGCLFFSQPIVSTVGVDISNIENIKSFEVSPNPTKNNLQVEIVSSTFSNAEIIFTDVSGKIVLTKQLKLNSGKNKFAFNDLALAKGFYNVQLSSPEKTITRKLIVE